MKNNAIKMLCLAVAMLAFAGTTQAQFRHFRQSVYLNGALPTGQFASSISDNTVVPLTYTNVGKDAIIGFGAGYRVSYRFPIGMGEVAPFVSADVFWNMLNGDWRDKYLNAHMTAPTYLNIPVMAGISYNYDELNTTFPVIPFAEFAIGSDMMMITREGNAFKKGDAVNNTGYFAYKPSFDVAWMIGAGVYLGNYVSVGAYYYGLGKHTVDYTDRTLKENSVASLQVAADEAIGAARQTRTVGNLALRVGFHF